jgi:N-acetylmuramoyl-L-alanine amidase
MAQPKLNPFKRRLIRAAVQENIEVMHEQWPRLFPPPPLPRLFWFSWTVGVVIACTLTSFVFVVALGSHELRKPDQLSSAVTTVKNDAAASPVLPLDVVHPAPAMEGAKKIDEADPPALLEEAVDLALPAPRPSDFRTLALPVKSIVLDPGHGGEDPGAIAATGLTEKAIALDIAQRLRTLLQNASFHVHMTREKDDTTSLWRRVAFANAAGGDLFLSIHVNWIAPRSARVAETYYLGPTEDSASLQLAGVENARSGYSTSDFRRLLEGVYEDVKRKESQMLAAAVQGELTLALQQTNPALVRRAAKQAPFLVLIGARMPAVLTEVSCLSNKEEAQLLATSEYRQQIAQALFAGIRAYVDGLYHTYSTRKDAAS